MASHPPAQCCTVGVRHEGTPEGTFNTTNGVESYIARPSDGKKHDGVGVLFLTDVMGNRLENPQLLADQFAANGYLTVVPDIMFGEPVPLNRPSEYSVANWRRGIPPEGKEGVSHAPDVVQPLVDKVVAWMKQPEQGCRRIAALGYCYGAKFVINLLKEGPGAAGGADVGYVAHPSFVDAESLAGIRGPLSIAAAEVDRVFPDDMRYKTEGILKNLSPRQPFQINYYSGCSHGFAIRGDLSDPSVKFAKEQAFLQAVHWMDKWLLK